MANENENKAADAPKAPEPQPKVAPQPKASPQQQQPKAGKAPDADTNPPDAVGDTSAPRADDPEDTGRAGGVALEDNPMTRANMGDAQAAPRRGNKAPRFGPMPGPDELAKIRKQKFGDKPGTVRLDAAPPNSGPDASATQLVFVDGDGREVGREDYVPGNYR